MQRISQALAAAIPPSSAGSDSSSIRTHLNSPTDSVFPRDAWGYPTGGTAGGSASANASGISQVVHHSQRGSISAQSHHSVQSGYGSNPSGIILRDRDHGTSQQLGRSTSPAAGNQQLRWAAGGTNGDGLIWDDPRRTRFYYPSAAGTTDGSQSAGGSSSVASGTGGPRALGKSQSAMETTAVTAYGSSTGSSLAPGPAGVPSKRPGLLRQVSENSVLPGVNSRSRSPSPAMRSILASREAAGRDKSRDRTVRVNLSGTSSSGGSGGTAKRVKLSAMAHGPKDGLYAVGGGQHLKVVQIKQAVSGGSTPIPEEERRPRSGQSGSILLGKGQGGVRVEEVGSLWRGNWAVTKSVTDLDWGVGAFENKVVTATPSGNYMLFDVNRGKLEKDVSTGQPRPLNCVQFCRAAPGTHGSILLTGGTEGQAKIWDLRDRDPVQRKYFKHSTPITSLCFSPSETYSFVVGLENGSIRRYDLRQGVRAVGAVYGAHGTKAVLDLKWKAAAVPGSAGSGDTASSSSASGGWLASAGVDSVVQIWDMSQAWDKPVPVHTLHTSCPVRRVAWRPGHETELAIVRLDQPFKSSVLDSADSAQQLSTSASSTTSSRLAAPQGSSVAPCFVDSDASLEIWDVRRHYVAKYAVPAPDGLPVDVAWGEDDRSLVACFQAGTFAQLDTKESIVPLDTVPRQVLSWSIKGEMAFACDRFRPGEVPFDDLKPEYANNGDKIGKRPKAVSDARYEPLQAMGTVPLDDIDADEFAYLAQQYRLSGDTPIDLCRWNLEVADSCGRHEDARLWGFLLLLMEEFDPVSGPQTGTFDEGIFSHPHSQSTDYTARVPSPPPMSPRGSASRLEDLRASVPPPRGVPMQAVGLDKASDLEELLASPRSGHSSGSNTPQKSKFKAFLPPEQRRVSEARSSVSTIVPDRERGKSASLASSVILERSTRTGGTGAHTHSSSQSSQRSRDKHSSNGSNGALSGVSSSKLASSLMMTTASSKSLYDWPDPYGIIMDAGTSTSNSASNSATASAINSGRTSPVLRRTKQNAGPAAASTRGSEPPSSPVNRLGFSTHASDRDGDSRRTSDEQRKRQVSQQQHRPDRGQSALAQRDESQTSQNGREKEFDRASWRAYRAQRCRPFLQWWSSYVDDGEVQLAASVLVVGRRTVDFPRLQGERLCHAYIEMLYRHRMPVPAAALRLASAIPSLEIYAQDVGVTHIAHCQRCRKATGTLEDIGDPSKRFWFCKRCRLAARVCAVCRLGVKGIWMGCGKCKHGGHQRCMRQYYSHSEATTPQGTTTSHGELLTRPAAVQRTRSAEDRPAGGQSSDKTRRYSHSGPGGAGLSSNNPAAIAGGNGDTLPATPTPVNVPPEPEPSIGYNPCPSGCGCKCRTMVGTVVAYA